MKTIAAVVLAAGGSRRLGRAKQGVVIDGVSLLRRAILASCESSVDAVFCVLGPDAQTHARELEGTRAIAVVNDSWERGVGTSIRAGLAAVRGASHNAMLVTLCDQPFVNGAVLDRIVSAYRARANGIRAVASRYGEVTGVPALFDESLFLELDALGDDEGARRVLNSRAGDVAIIDVPEAATDVDTEDDITRLSHRERDPKTRV